MTQPPYTSDLEDHVETWARMKISPNRIEHVRGVVNTADALARRYAPDDVVRARLAGWIHDAAKHWTPDELLDYAVSHKLTISDGERAVPMLLHGAVGYALAADVFGLDDAELREACALHTTGAPGMGTLAKTVLIADLIEPGRDFPGVEHLRREAGRDLDAALLLATNITLRYLLDKQKLIDPRALALHNELVSAGVRYEK